MAEEKKVLSRAEMIAKLTAPKGAGETVSPIVEAERVTVDVELSYREDGGVVLVIPVINLAEKMLFTKNGNPKIVLSIPKVTLTVKDADGRTATQYGSIPYGQVQMMIKES